MGWETILLFSGGGGRVLLLLAAVVVPGSGPSAPGVGLRLPTASVLAAAPASLHLDLGLVVPGHRSKE